MNEVITNNYDTLNKAIDVEVEKAQAWSRLRYSQAALNVCLGIGALLLLAAIAFYIYAAALKLPDNKAIERVIERVEGTQERLELRDDLRELEQRDAEVLEIIESDTIVPPEKQYTAFTRVTAESGETIVTGRNFIAGEWARPISQFCYRSVPGLVGGDPIAEIPPNSSDIVVTTTDVVLQRFANNYCRFE